MDLSHFAVWKLNSCVIKILKNLWNAKIHGPNYKRCEWKENKIDLEDFIEEEKHKLDIEKGFVGFECERRQEGISN